ncbi:hypothetical protein [Phenylobacterium koreense]|uniref:Uncharacterized protein n=1 Tax=Phenylobacterium koreense TaxID=266125 RepID=A0ABV2EJN0_9CAUL
MARPNAPRLAVVQSTANASTVSERVRQLQAQAKVLAREHVEELLDAMKRVERLAAEIGEGGDAYPAGIRDLARRVAEDAEVKAQAIEAIGGRAQ